MIKLYYHGGCLNHGCEAIVRSSKKIINKDMILYTRDITSDKKYNLNRVVSLAEDTNDSIRKNSMKYFMAAIHHKFSHTDYLFIKYQRENFFKDVKKNDLYLSIGGDNYCYEGKDILKFYNQIIHKKGGKTVLWGCSFEPKDMNHEIEKDIALYDYIITRESLSYEVLKKVNPNISLIPDPAFQLDKVELPLPKKFLEKNTVGINVSPLIMACEKNQGITYINYKRLVEYIINNTNMNIALIPHVVEVGNDDRTPLELLFNEFRDTDRIILIDDCNAMELKGYIARCRFFVGARTHATIAAYSTMVPTLVVGYSIKARGIAKDIFGTDKNYVLPVQLLKDSNDLTNAFIWLQKNEKKICNHLQEHMPDYCKKSLLAGEIVRRLTES